MENESMIAEEIAKAADEYVAATGIPNSGGYLEAAFEAGVKWAREPQSSLSAQVQDVAGWQDISTAPNTNHMRQILLAWKHRPVSTGWWDVDEDYSSRPKAWKSPEEGWRADGDACIPVKSGWPTHWMQPPAPPKDPS